ncbi:glycosyltransferase family 2 protein [Lacisediminihabitans sp. FW035]|uniref:glycosyltransferase family 2 protein n=1 Tax=Frigoribacterium sp. UYMn621 TaxID=3156343 RepID=UPI0033946C8F
MTRQKISIITPCYNEEGNVAACAAEVARVMEIELGEFDYEHIFCDNASTDGTLSALRELAAADPHVKVIVNSRNVGPFRSMANGLKSVTGDIIVPMIPADLQDPPSAIPGMIALLTPAVEVVYGIRANRRESILMRAARNSYYLALRSSGGATPPPHAGEFMVARREVIDAISEVGGSYPYIRGLVAQTNPRFETYTYEWARRDVGKSKNSIPDLIDQALNGIVTTARTPIRWALFLGLVFAFVGVVIGIVNLLIFLVGGSSAAPGIPTLIVATFLFGGVNLFFLGLIGEYILSIHSSVRPEPPMFERERINFD